MPFIRQIDDKAFYSISEAAAILGCGRSWIKDNVELIDVRGYKHKKVPRSEIRRLMGEDKERHHGIKREQLPANARKDLDRLERRSRKNTN